jgi:hypothetical protein
MTTILAGKPHKTHKWAKMTRIQKQITTVIQTTKIGIMNAMTQTNEHLHHTTMATIRTSDLAMIMDDHLHMIAPTPKRVAQATDTKAITDKAHHSTTERKYTKINREALRRQWSFTNQRDRSHTKTDDNSNQLQQL